MALITEVSPDALRVEAIALPHGKIRTSVISALRRIRGILDAVAEMNGLPVLEKGHGTQGAASIDMT